MSIVYQSLLTFVLTLLGGVILFILSQLLLKLIIEPLQELNRVISKVKSDLVFYANRYTNYKSWPKKDLDETTDTLRRDATELLAAAEKVACYNLLVKLRLAIPKSQIYVAHSNLIGLSNSLSETNIKLIVRKRAIIEACLSNNYVSIEEIQQESPAVPNIPLSPDLNQKLAIMSEEASIGTLDNVLLAILFFIVSFDMSLLSLGVPDAVKTNPIMLVAFFYNLILVIPILYLIWGYATSVFSVDGRFMKKINILATLESMVLFLGGVIFLAFLFWFYESFLKLGKVSNEFVYISFILMIFIIIFIGIFYIKSRMKEYFIKNYSNLFLKRLSQLTREQQNKVLKKWGVTYGQIKESAERNR